jgi:hypothetical protein
MRHILPSACALLALVGCGGPTAPAGKHHEDLRLGSIMGDMQRFHHKLWLAGEAGNTELAAFYLHELEETMELVADAGIVDDGHDVSALMRTHGLPVVGAMERKLKEEGIAALHADAPRLVEACNSCHAAAGHGYIHITLPTGAAYPGQEFAPKPSSVQLP